MGRKGGSRLLRREAEDIADKLHAEMEEGGSHTHAKVRYNGVLITQFGIRRDKKAKHGHIPHSLFISESQAVALARCSMSEEEYFAVLKRKNKLPA